MKRWLAVAACLWINGLAVSHLPAQQRATHGYLGVGVANIAEERVKELKLKDAHGVIVMNVGEETPAANAGLKVSDVIVEFNGQPVNAVEQFTHLVRETQPNRRVTIRIVRGGIPQTLNATLTTRVVLHNDNYFEVQVPPMPRMPWDEVPPGGLPPFPPMPPHSLFWQQSPIGMEGEALNGQLAEFFGVKEGVLVRSVVHESPAEKAGIKAGDVVVRVMGKTVRSPQELSREVRALSGAATPVTLTVVRNRKESSFTLKQAGEDQN